MFVFCFQFIFFDLKRFRLVFGRFMYWEANEVNNSWTKIQRKFLQNSFSHLNKKEILPSLSLNSKNQSSQALGFQKLAKLSIFGIFNELLSTQDVNASLAMLNDTFSVIFKHRASVIHSLGANWSTSMGKKSQSP